jgi:hypothetical protein
MSLPPLFGGERKAICRKSERRLPDNALRTAQPKQSPPTPVQGQPGRDFHSKQRSALEKRNYEHNNDGGCKDHFVKRETRAGRRDHAKRYVTLANNAKLVMALIVVMGSLGTKKRKSPAEGKGGTLSGAVQ